MKLIIKIIMFIKEWLMLWSLFLVPTGIMLVFYIFNDLEKDNYYYSLIFIFMVSLIGLLMLNMEMNKKVMDKQNEKEMERLRDKFCK
jgi:uncharacterized membrane protein